MGSLGGGGGLGPRRCHRAVIDDSPAAGEEQPGLGRLQRRGRGQAMNISERQPGLGDGVLGVGGGRRSAGAG